MTNAEEIDDLRASLTARLSEGEENSAALELMAQSLSDMERLAKLDATYAPLFEHLQRVYTDFESIAASIGSDSEDLEYDPDQLNSINARLSALSDLKRKYGPTIEDILRHRDEIAAEVDQYDRRDELLAALKADREKAHANALQRASDLSKKRSAAATKLEKRIQSILNSLEMGGGNFKVSLTSCDLNLRGAERAEFLISANAGESPKPLRQIASGGEISRVMLAIKAVFADVDPVYTLVFDEIDAGIGGAVANHVASTMALLARDHQVICVTHLAQIAAQANAHFLVSKSTAKRRTMTEVAGIEGEPRVQEIARLLDGSVSDASMHHARSLLSQTTRRSA